MSRNTEDISGVDLISRLRRDYKLSVREIAQLLDVSRSYMSQVINGRPPGSDLQEAMLLLETQLDEDPGNALLPITNPDNTEENRSIVFSIQSFSRLKTAASFLGRDVQELADELITNGLDRLTEAASANLRKQQTEEEKGEALAMELAEEIADEIIEKVDGPKKRSKTSIAKLT